MSGFARHINFIRMRRYRLRALSTHTTTKLYPKVSGLAEWSENCKWYSSLLLGAVASLFNESI